MLVINEFPKCGGNWIVNVVAQVLGWQRADLYDLMPAPRVVDSRHPWYGDADGAPLRRGKRTVVKGHEFPYSPLLPAHAPVVSLIRNPLDVAVSKWFYERDFLPANGLGEAPELAMEDYLRTTVDDWAKMVGAWCDTDAPMVTYESLRDGDVSGLCDVLSAVGVIVDEKALGVALRAETPAVTSASLGRLYRHNTFVRKAAVGDWRQHIPASLVDELLQTASPTLEALAVGQLVRGSAALLRAVGIEAPRS